MPATSDDKVLSRDFTISVNTGTSGNPTWTPIGGLDEDGISIKTEVADVDFADANDGGFAKPVPIGYSYTVTLKGARIENADDGTRDAGQAALEAVQDEVGPDALLEFQIESPAASGGEVLTFEAWPNVTAFGGGEKAAWEAELSVYGQITRT